MTPKLDPNHWLQFSAILKTVHFGGFVVLSLCKRCRYHILTLYILSSYFLLGTRFLISLCVSKSYLALTCKNWHPLSVVQRQAISLHQFLLYFSIVYSKSLNCIFFFSALAFLSSFPYQSMSPFIQILYAQ